MKNSLISWANKYNLVDDKLVNKTFLEIGLWAIPGRRGHAQSVEDWKIFFGKMDREIPRDFLHWSITDYKYIEEERDDIEKVIHAGYKYRTHQDRKLYHTDKIGNQILKRKSRTRKFRDFYFHICAGLQ